MSYKQSIEEINKSLKEVEKSLKGVKKYIKANNPNSTYNLAKFSLFAIFTTLKTGPKVIKLSPSALIYLYRLKKQGKNQEEIKTLMQDKFGLEIDKIDKYVMDTFDKHNFPLDNNCRLLINRLITKDKD